MTRPRDIESRLAVFDDLSGILNAMRSFALAELRRVGRHEAAQRAADTALAQAVADVATALPQPPAGARRDLWVLLGSVRGFCGSYNEDVARHFRQRRAAIGTAIVVGERLGALLAGPDDVVRVAGAVGAADAADTIERIVRALDDPRTRPEPAQGLVICWRDEGGVAERRILPIDVPAQAAAGNRPVTFTPLPQVAAGVARHYVFHRLLSSLVGALRVENQMRLLLMENALRHIERKREDLRRSRNQLRQEEIVEEIELIGQRRPAAESAP
jgi:F-type H+-transporting ATPase subunit gamma